MTVGYYWKTLLLLGWQILLWLCTNIIYLVSGS